MDWNDVARNWAAFSAPILQRWPYVAEGELARIDGNYDLFVSELAKTDGGSIEAAQEQIALWLASGIPADVIMDEHHDDASIALSAQSIPDGETAGDDNRAFGDEFSAERQLGRP